MTTIASLTGVMVPSAFLRAYVPADRLDADERATDDGGADPRIWRELGEGPLGVLVPTETAAGWSLDRPGGRLVCPSRVRLRSLVGILALRDQYPAGIAEGLVPDDLASTAALELEALRYSGRLRSHVLQSPWQVPLRWFVPFAPEQRRFDPQRRKLTYECVASVGLERARAAAEIVESAGLESELVDAIIDMGEWLEDFCDDDAVVELDYGGLAGLMTDDELRDDHSVADLWESIDALGRSDIDASSEAYERITVRWSAVRAHENAN